MPALRDGTSTEEQAIPDRAPEAVTDHLSKSSKEVPRIEPKPETGACCEAPGLYVPTIEEIKSELWKIAIGDGSESSRVSALRALADVMGLLKSTGTEFPAGMNALLDALAEGLHGET